MPLGERAKRSAARKSPRGRERASFRSASSARLASSATRIRGIRAPLCIRARCAQRATPSRSEPRREIVRTGRSLGLRWRRASASACAPRLFSRRRYKASALKRPRNRGSPRILNDIHYSRALTTLPSGFLRRRVQSKRVRTDAGRVRNDERGLIAAGLLAESSVRAVIYAALGGRPLIISTKITPAIFFARRRAFFRRNRAFPLSRLASNEAAARSADRPAIIFRHANDITRGIATTR